GRESRCRRAGVCDARLFAARLERHDALNVVRELELLLAVPPFGGSSFISHKKAQETSATKKAHKAQNIKTKSRGQEYHLFVPFARFCGSIRKVAANVAASLSVKESPSRRRP